MLTASFPVSNWLREKKWSNYLAKENIHQSVGRIDGVSLNFNIDHWATVAWGACSIDEYKWSYEILCMSVIESWWPRYCAQQRKPDLTATDPSDQQLIREVLFRSHHHKPFRSALCLSFLSECLDSLNSACVWSIESWCTWIFILRQLVTRDPLKKDTLWEECIEKEKS